MKKQKAKNKIAKISGKIAYNFHVSLPYTVSFTEEDDNETFVYILNHEDNAIGSCFMPNENNFGKHLPSQKDLLKEATEKLKEGKFEAWSSTGHFDLTGISWEEN